MRGRLINSKQANFICKLLSGKDIPIMKVASKARISHVTAYGIVKELEEKGLIMVGRRGRTCIINPTNPGIEMVELLNKLVFILN